jgi:Peptidase A4 family
MRGVTRRFAVATVAVLFGSLIAVPMSASASSSVAARAAGLHAAAGPASRRAAALRAARLYLATHRVTAPSVSAGTYDTENWSGVVDDDSTGDSYSYVAAHWLEPAIEFGSCSTSSPTQIVVFWVGLDGWSSDSEEQDGSMAECYRGNFYYYTWWEMWPQVPSIQIVGTTVSPGDKIEASVGIDLGGSYVLQVTDATQPANSFKEVETCTSTCDDASADWIAEAPLSDGKPVPLPYFGYWQVATASVVGNDSAGYISSFPYDFIDMDYGSIVVDVLSLTKKGRGFQDTILGY